MGRIARTIAALGVVCVLSACSPNDSLAAQYAAGSNKGYIAGDGTIMEIPVAKRAAAVSFSGVDANGDAVRSEDFRGRVLVVNFWYAGCAPCRAEAPLLNTIAESLDPSKAAILGVNVRDQADTVRAFTERFRVPFPSIIDTNTGGVQLAFTGSVPANAVPTTLVLDQDGRVAARILGRIPEESILRSIIDDLIAANG